MCMNGGACEGELWGREAVSACVVVCQAMASLTARPPEDFKGVVREHMVTAGPALVAMCATLLASASTTTAAAPTPTAASALEAGTPASPASAPGSVAAVAGAASPAAAAAAGGGGGSAGAADAAGAGAGAAVDTAPTVVPAGGVADVFPVPGCSKGFAQVLGKMLPALTARFHPAASL